MTDADDRHTRESSLREQYVEYVFLGALCQEMWRRGVSMDILRAHTDQSGYDLVLDAGSALRFVQLKSSHEAAKAAGQTVSLKLATRPGGCVVWVFFRDADLGLAHFLWFGDADPAARCPDLGDRVARRTTPRSDGTRPERSGLRVIPKARFDRVDDVGQLADLLFGTAPGALA